MISQYVTLIDQGRQVVATAQVAEQDGTFAGRINLSRGRQFAQYRKIPSFAEYVLVAQDECHVEHFVKQADGLWVLSETDRLEDVLTLSSIECTLLLSDMYEKVEFPTA